MLIDLATGGSSSESGDLIRSPIMVKGRGTLAEVARVCEVSRSTVSRVLSNRQYGRFSVTAEVRERIVRIAQELNYRPSVAARNMTASKTNLIAVLGIRSIDPEYGGPIERSINSFVRKLDHEGYEIYLQMNSCRHSAYELPRLRVDGIVAVGPEHLSELEALERSGIPYVSVNGVVGEQGMSVSPDDRGGTFAALRHLLELGHQTIAYLDHPAIDATHPSVFERRQAFFDGKAQFGFTVPNASLSLLSAGEPWAAYYEPFLQKMVVEGGATAVLTYSHYSALSLLRRAHMAGLRVPKDFSIVCFNDEPIVSLSTPALTAVAWPSDEVGHAGAEMLLTRIGGGVVTQPHRRLNECLIVRESTAPPPKSKRGNR